jgi:excinuclease Cho
MLTEESLKHQIAAECLDALPRSSGVYIFRGEGTLPLYIGKSVDIRARVLSHLRTPDEAKMIAQTRQIDFIETAGEIGALLLEAQMIKTHNPLYNVRLRRLRNLNSIRLNKTDTGLATEIISSKDAEIGQVDGFYGLFSSPKSAQERLRELAKEHELCNGLLGLEKLSKRGCFGLQIKMCRGACAGLEERAAHDERLLSSLVDLKVHIWPYKGPIDLVESRDGWTQKHRIDSWRHLGTWCSKTQSTTHQTQSTLDLDTYKILVKPIMLGTATVTPV